MDATPLSLFVFGSVLGLKLDILCDIGISDFALKFWFNGLSECRPNFDLSFSLIHLNTSFEPLWTEFITIENTNKNRKKNYFDLQNK